MAGIMEISPTSGVMVRVKLEFLLNFRRRALVTSNGRQTVSEA